MRVLITRPEPDAARTQARLREMGHETIIAPVLALEQAKNVSLPIGSFDGIAVTSANAMRAASSLEGLKTLLALPVFAIGARTAEAVRAAGFEAVTFSQGDAEDLAKLVAQRLQPESRLLHLAGEHRAREFSALLAPARIEAVTCVLYRMRAMDNLPPAAAEAIAQGTLQAVLHYSPRSAAVFVTLLERAGLADRLGSLRHLCLSQAVAAPIAAAGGKTETARRPDESGLLSLL